jgi:hypothetical protein
VDTLVFKQLHNQRPIAFGIKFELLFFANRFSIMIVGNKVIRHGRTLFIIECVKTNVSITPILMGIVARNRSTVLQRKVTYQQRLAFVLSTNKPRRTMDQINHTWHTVVGRRRCSLYAFGISSIFPSLSAHEFSAIGEAMGTMFASVFLFLGLFVPRLSRRFYWFF